MCARWPKRVRLLKQQRVGGGRQIIPRSGAGITEEKPTSYAKACPTIAGRAPGTARRPSWPWALLLDRHGIRCIYRHNMKGKSTCHWLVIGSTKDTSTWCRSVLGSTELCGRSHMYAGILLGGRCQRQLRRGSLKSRPGLSAPAPWDPPPWSRLGSTY